MTRVTVKEQKQMTSCVCSCWCKEMWEACVSAWNHEHIKEITSRTMCNLAPSLIYFLFEFLCLSRSQREVSATVTQNAAQSVRKIF
jgi:hypothetical protein